MAHAFAYWEYRDSVDFYSPMAHPFPITMDYHASNRAAPLSPDGPRILRRFITLAPDLNPTSGHANSAAHMHE
jgi:hypothetical protein